MPRGTRSWIATPLASLLLLVTASCSHQSDGPTPKVTAPLMPQAACNDQVASVIVLTGDGFSPLNDHVLLDTERLELPQVSLECGRSLEPSDPDTCDPDRTTRVPNDPDDATKSDEAWASMTSMSFGVCPQGVCSTVADRKPPLLIDWPPTTAFPTGVPTGIFNIKVVNRNGHETTANDALAIVPPPRVDRVEADLLCKDQENKVVITGDWFVIAGSMQPEVRLFDDAGLSVKLATTDVELSDCRDLRHPADLTLKACKTITATIPKGTVDLVKPDDTFRNVRLEVAGVAPITCHSTQDIEITFVPEPKVTRVEPDIACDAQGDRVFMVRGTGFLTIDGKLPVVNLTGMTMDTASAASDCTDVGRSGFPREKVQSCKTITFTVPKGQLPPTNAGDDPINYMVTVTNPPPADCTSTPPVDLTITSPPLLLSATPDLACTAQSDRSFVLDGKGFVVIDGMAPSVVITDAKGTMVMAMTTAVDMSCKDFPGPTEMLKVCTQLTVTVAKGALADGLATFRVDNPMPAGCNSTEMVTALIVPPPVLLSVAPAQVCSSQGPVPVVLTGTDFLTIDGLVPVATFDDGKGMKFTGQNGMASNCEAVMGVKESVQRCTTLTVSVPQNAVPVMATFTITVTNPDPAGCTSVVDVNKPVTIIGTPPPTISSVTPTTLCAGGGTLTLTGTNFLPGAQVNVGPLQTQSVNVQNPMLLTANVGFGLPPGMYPVVLRNGDGCSATAGMQVTVVQGLTVFFADPPVVWNGINTQITLYGANVVPPIKSVGLVLTGTNNPPIQLQVSASVGNKATALVPVNTPAGTYDIVVADQGCGAVLVAGLKVVAQTSFAITRIDPAYGSTQADTSVTITSMAAFKATPRAYLSAGGMGVATPLSAVSFADTSTLTAVVPKGTPVGVYDLIVVNPDGTVGVLKTAFTVIQNLTPVVLSLQPAVVNTQVNQQFVVAGNNFAMNAAVSLSCFDVANMPVPAPMISAAAPANCNVGNAKQCITVTGTFPGTIGYCVVTVTNPADKASFDFSSLVVSNPALKLPNFLPASTMKTARRAFGLATVNATPSARFLYAVGGDNGTESGAMTSVEAAQVSIYGKLGTWFTLQNPLSSKRTFVGLVAIERFLYAVGGSAGAGGLNTVERAYVLNPADAPRWTDLNLDLPPQGQTGVPGGIFYYRVSAVMDGNDPLNPLGENLPSDAQVIQTPNLMNGAYITLTWGAVPGAASYRIYRSPTPNLGSGTEVLVADNVMGTSYQDKYAQPVMQNGQTVKPLVMGSTGKWNALALTLKAGRSGVGVVTLANLAAPATRYLYALGGNSSTEANPAALTSTEYFTITVNADNSQTVAAGAASPALAQARWQHGAYASAITVNNQLVNQLWVLGGLTGGAGTSTGSGELSAAGGSGVPAAWSAINKTPGAHAGFAAWIANNFLYVFGGDAGAPSTGGVQGDIASTPPQPFNWPNATGALTTARYLMGFTQQSGFFFACGGTSVANMPPVASCETTIY